MKIDDLLRALEAMPEVIERASGPIMLDFIPVTLKKELHNDAGAIFKPQTYFVNPDNGAIYALESGNLTGYAITDAGELIGFEWSTGRPVTLYDIMTLAANDETLAPLVDITLYNSFFDDLAGQISFDDLANPPSIEPAPLKMTTTAAHAYTLGKDKLNRIITKLHDNEEVNLATLSGRTVGITAKAWRRHAGGSESLNLTGAGTITAAKSVITPSMLPVLNALNSIWNHAAENRIAPAFTLASLYNQIHGIEEYTHIQESALEELRQTLDEMTDIFMKVDATKEITARFKNDPITAADILRDTWEGALIALDKRKIEIGGFVGEGYILLRRPLNYQAAQVTRQVITIPAREINTPKINNSLFVASLRDYLLSEVDYMANDRRRSNKINYNSVYEYLGITAENYKNVKDKRAKTRTQVKKLLEQMQENGRIKSYTEYSQGRGLAGVLIELPPAEIHAK